MEELLDCNLSQVVRELSLFACNDRELFENHFKPVIELAHTAGQMELYPQHKVFRAVYNTIPHILLRYHILFGGIGCKLSQLSKLILAKDIVQDMCEDEA